MKKLSFYKDFIRTIVKSLPRFLSITAIIAIGVGFYAGINATEPDMQLSADAYYKKNRLSDFRIVAPMGFKSSDISAVVNTEGVMEVQEGYSKDLFLESDVGNTSIVRLYSYNSKDYNEKDNQDGGLNVPHILEGRMPLQSGEITLEHGVNVSREITLGSMVSLSVGNDENTSDVLKKETFVVVGVIDSPLYIDFERGQTNIGDGSVDFFAYIMSEDFALEKYTDLFIRTMDSSSFLAYSEGYKSHLEPIKKAMEDLGTAAMSSTIRDAEEEVAKGRKELADQWREAETQLEEAWDKLLAAEKEISDGRKELDSNYIRYSEEMDRKNIELGNGWEALSQGRSRLAAEEAKVAAEEAKLDAVMAQLTGGLTQPGDMMPSGDSGIDPEAAKAQLEAAKAQMEAAKAQIGAAKAQLADSRIKLDATEAMLAEGERALLQGRQDLEKSTAEGRLKLEDAGATLASGKSSYESEKADAIQKKKDAQVKLDDAEKKIASIPDGWFVNTRDGNPGYSGYGDDIQRIGSVAKVFPLFFFLVAALVCLTTMTRMVEEERMQIGTLKALGYKATIISSKYIAYALLSSLTGAIIGLSVGFQLFPTVILNAYAIMYKIHGRVTPFHWNYAWVSILLSVFTTMTVTLLVAMKELRATPASLLQPKAPKPGKRILLERLTPIWRRMSFIYKVTARNLFRYKQRFLMTIFGIAGCTALLLTGFGLRNSINDIVDIQFDDIFLYDGQVYLDRDKDLKERDLGKILGENPDVKSYLSIFSQAGDVLKGEDRSYAINLMVPKDGADLGEFIDLHHRVSREKIQVPSEGAVITEKISELLGLHIGDVIKYRNPDNAIYELEVASIAENYISHYIFVSPEYYQKVSREEPDYNGGLFLLKQPAAIEESAFKEGLMKHSGVLGSMLVKSLSDKVQDTMGSLVYVVFVLILSAGVLAFVVLYNLTNINITERIREIATIKVLGFWDKEVSAYVYRENISLSLLGALTGLAMGFLLHRYVMSTMEVDSMMFGKKIHLVSYFFSILLTMVFSLFVNLIMFYKLKNINMVESLKSIE